MWKQLRLLDYTWKNPVCAGNNLVVCGNIQYLVVKIMSLTIFCIPSQGQTGGIDCLKCAKMPKLPKLPKIKDVSHLLKNAKHVAINPPELRSDNLLRSLNTLGSP
jgi:hypothetical protein